MKDPARRRPAHCARTKSMQRTMESVDRIHRASADRSPRPCKEQSSLLPVFRKFSPFCSTILRAVIGGDSSHVNKCDEMPAREETDLCTDKVLSKSRILLELTKAVKLVSKTFYCGNSLGRQGRSDTYTKDRNKGFRARACKYSDTRNIIFARLSTRA